MNDAKPNLRLASANGGEESAKTGGEAQGEGSIAQSGRIVESIESGLQDEKRSLEFCLDEETGRVLIRVRDPDQRKLIRQIAFEQAVRLIVKIHDRLSDRSCPLR